MWNDQELTVEQMADAFAAVERHSFPLEVPLFMSIDQLQKYRPDLTDEILAAQYDIIRGRDFVTAFKGEILRGVEL